MYALFPDKELYGLDKKEEDKIIYTDVLFNDMNCYSLKRYKDYILKIKYVDSFANRLFSDTYESEIYGFNK